MIWIAVFFILLGIVIKYGKMYGLIAGYNTMTPQEKSKYNIEKISTLFRNVMFSMAFIISLGYFATKILTNSMYEKLALISAIAIGIPYLVIQSNSNKFKNPVDKK
ncbi:MAG TPA: DUF3784 domain-containing protein [Flavobacteriaceae bacterium]|nr:DUF3784 domain-containing protein [Flavobacteriaceae bacterium]